MTDMGAFNRYEYPTGNHPIEPIADYADRLTGTYYQARENYVMFSPWHNPSILTFPLTAPGNVGYVMITSRA